MQSSAYADANSYATQNAVMQNFKGYTQKRHTLALAPSLAVSALMWSGDSECSGDASTVAVVWSDGVGASVVFTRGGSGGGVRGEWGEWGPAETVRGTSVFTVMLGRGEMVGGERGEFAGDAQVLVTTEEWRGEPEGEVPSDMSR